MNPRNTLYVITGPTASGKSALAVELARRLDTEIISADSRQVYRGIPIVTAVPTEEERGGVVHNLMEILPLEAYYSASEFEQDALRISNRLFNEKGCGVVCGGSMMYIDALCNGIDDLPTVPESIRASLMAEWKTNGDRWLLNELLRLDPAYYNKVDQNNLKRVFHAIEITLTAGQPYSSLLTGTTRRRDFKIVKVALGGDRQRLFDRINRRVLNMVEAGLEEEARSVYARRELNSLNTVGLKEMFAWFDGKMTKDEAIARIQKNTRVYAKKQLTWHKRDESLIWLDFEASPYENAQKILDLNTPNQS